VEAYVITWDKMLPSGTNFNVEQILSWETKLSCGIKCYHLGTNVVIWIPIMLSYAIMWDEILSSGANVIM
jgi:hypothetical protein